MESKLGWKSRHFRFKKRYILEGLFCFVLPTLIFWTLQAALNVDSGGIQIRLGMITLLKIVFICCMLYFTLAKLLFARVLPTWFPEKSIERANRLASKGMIKESLALLQLVYSAEDTIVDSLDILQANAHNFFGIHLLDKVRIPEKAIESFQKALRINPQMSMPKYNLGITYRRLGDVEQARKYLNEFLQDPGKEGKPYVKAAEGTLADIERKG